MRWILVVLIFVTGTNTISAQTFANSVKGMATLPTGSELASQVKNLMQRLTSEAKIHFSGIRTKEEYVSDASINFLNFYSPRVIDGGEKGFHQFDAAMMDFKSEDTLRLALSRLKDAVAQTGLGQPTLQKGQDGFVWEKKLNGNPFTVTIWRYSWNVYFEMHEYHSDEAYAAQKSARYAGTTALTGVPIQPEMASTKTEMATAKTSIVKGKASPQMVADCKSFITKLTSAAPSHLSTLKGVSETSYRWLSTVPFLDFERNLIIESGGKDYFTGIKKYTDAKKKNEDFAKIADAIHQAGFGTLVKDVSNKDYRWEVKNASGSYVIVMQNFPGELWVDFNEVHPSREPQSYTSNSGSSSGNNTGSEKEQLSNQLQYQKNMTANLEQLTKKLKEIDKRFDECQKISNNISDASRKKLTGFYIENESKKLAGKLIDIKYDLKQLLREYDGKVPESNVRSIQSLIDHAEDWLESMEEE